MRWPPAPTTSPPSSKEPDHAGHHREHRCAALVVSLLGVAGTFALAKLTRLLGEKRVAALREMLTPAIERAIAQAQVEGLTGQAAQEWVTDYVRQTMADTLRKLEATARDLSKRVAAELAENARV